MHAGQAYVRLQDQITSAECRSYRIRSDSSSLTTSPSHSATACSAVCIMGTCRASCTLDSGRFTGESWKDADRPGTDVDCMDSWPAAACCCGGARKGGRGFCGEVAGCLRGECAAACSMGSRTGIAAVLRWIFCCAAADSFFNSNNRRNMT